MANEMTAVQAIRNFFFTKGETVAEVMKEVKQLTPEDKAELAEGAARELGVTLKS